MTTRIQELVNRYRNAIERMDKTNLPWLSAMENFPHGTCLNVCYVLGKYLEDQGVDGLEVVSAWKYDRESPRSHAWLQRGELIIDITADQFPEINFPVIVTSSSPWHDGWSEDRKMWPADYTLVTPHDDLAALDTLVRNALCQS